MAKKLKKDNNICLLCKNHDEEDLILMINLLVTIIDQITYCNLQNVYSIQKSVFRLSNFNKLINEIQTIKYGTLPVCFHKTFRKNLMKFLSKIGFREEFEKQVLDLERNSQNLIDIDKKKLNRDFKEKLVELINNKARIHQFENSLKNCKIEVLDNMMKSDKVTWMDKALNKHIKIPEEDLSSEKNPNNAELNIPLEENNMEILNKEDPKKDKSRKFLSNEALSILRKWFLDNINHPYPNYKEKVFLQNKTKLTMDQIQNWFTNSRKRLLKGAISKTVKKVKDKTDSEENNHKSSNKNQIVQQIFMNKEQKVNSQEARSDDKLTLIKKKQVIKKMLKNDKNASFYNSSFDDSSSDINPNQDKPNPPNWKDNTNNVKNNPNKANSNKSIDDPNILTDLNKDNSCFPNNQIVNNTNNCDNMLVQNKNPQNFNHQYNMLNLPYNNPNLFPYNMCYDMYSNQFNQNQINQKQFLLNRQTENMLYPQNIFDNQMNNPAFQQAQTQNTNLVDPRSNPFLNMINNNFDNKQQQQDIYLANENLKLTNKKSVNSDFDPTQAYNFNKTDSSKNSEISKKILTNNAHNGSFRPVCNDQFNQNTNENAQQMLSYFQNLNRPYQEPNNQANIPTDRFIEYEQNSNFNRNQSTNRYKGLERISDYGNILPPILNIQNEDIRQDRNINDRFKANIKETQFQEKDTTQNMFNKNNIVEKEDDEDEYGLTLDGNIGFSSFLKPPGRFQQQKASNPYADLIEKYMNNRRNTQSNSQNMNQTKAGTSKNDNSTKDFSKHPQFKAPEDSVDHDEYLGKRKGHNIFSDDSVKSNENGSEIDESDFIYEDDFVENMSIKKDSNYHNDLDLRKIDSIKIKGEGIKLNYYGSIKDRSFCDNSSNPRSFDLNSINNKLSYDFDKLMVDKNSSLNQKQGDSSSNNKEDDESDDQTQKNLHNNNILDKKKIRHNNLKSQNRANNVKNSDQTNSLEDNLNNLDLNFLDESIFKD